MLSTILFCFNMITVTVSLVHFRLILLHFLISKYNISLSLYTVILLYYHCISLSHDCGFMYTGLICIITVDDLTVLIVFIKYL